MLIAILAVQLVLVFGMVALFLRQPSSANTTPTAELEDKFDRLDTGIREALAGTRADALDQAARTRKESAASAAELRTEVLASITTLGNTLAGSLSSFREDNKTSGDQLRRAVETQLDLLAKRLSAFTAESGAQHTALRESLNAKVNELTNSNAALQERLRKSVEDGLGKLNADNTAKLEEMRATVDEKLHATLQSRLTESFGQVTDQLTKVHAGLGEMSKLSAGVDDLSRIFTNVKSRGTIGEVMLETLLKQMLAVNQYEKNARVKPGSSEMVEFAVKLPTPTGEALLPIDSKFPREAWERLETAYESGFEVHVARKALETAIRNEGKKICEKYIAPPHTTSFAIMFLPTEALYAEVMRSDGLQADIQQNCRVTIAGPSTLSAILSSFQMGFHMLQMQQKGDDVWKVLAGARTQFGKFEDLMSKMSKDVERVQNTILDVGTRTRAINRTLRDVSIDEGQSLATQPSFDGFLPALAASDSTE